MFSDKSAGRSNSSPGARWNVSCLPRISSKTRPTGAAATRLSTSVQPGGPGRERASAHPGGLCGLWRRWPGTVRYTRMRRTSKGHAAAKPLDDQHRIKHARGKHDEVLDGKRQGDQPGGPIRHAVDEISRFFGVSPVHFRKPCGFQLQPTGMKPRCLARNHAHRRPRHRFSADYHTP